MSRNLKFATGLVGGSLLFGAGIVVGLRVGHTAPFASVDAPPKSPLITKGAHAKPAIPADARAPVAATPSSPAMAQLAAVMELHHGGAVPLFGLSPLQIDRINPDFAAAFDLTPAERQEFDSAIARAKAELAQVEAANARVSPRAGGGVTISIPPYPKEGGEIFDRFVAQVEALLGPERAGYMREMHGTDSEQYWDLGRFGLMQTDIEVFPPRSGGNYTSTFGSGPDSRPGIAARTGSMDWVVLQLQFPLLYEKVLRETGTPPDPRP